MAPDALPVAANHAALTNRISMLLASQSSILKTLNPSSASKRPSSTSKKHTTTDIHAKTQAEKDDEDLFKNAARPNEGVGYIPPKTGAAADKTKEDRELRGRVLGKRGAEIVAERQRMQKLKKKKKEEESEDEDLGRSALGKRKRPRREVEVVEEPAVVEEVKEETTETQEDATETTQTEHVKMEEPQRPPQPTTGDSTKRKKKNKKKKNQSQV